MKARYAGWAAAAGLVVGLVGPVSAQSAARLPVAADARSPAEKITLQHIDVRIVAAALGLAVVPNELEVMGGSSYGGFGRSRGGGGYGSRGGYRGYPASGGYFSATPYGDPRRMEYGAVGRDGADWAPPSVPQPTPGGVVDPRTNSYLYRR